MAYARVDIIDHYDRTVGRTFGKHCVVKVMAGVGACKRSGSCEQPRDSGVELKILTVREQEVGCSHVIREFEFGIPTIGNTIVRSAREKLDFSGDGVPLDVVACMFRCIESQRF
jgi:hypothetical protein